jgi:hypothetical protein
MKARHRVLSGLAAPLISIALVLGGCRDELGAPPVVPEQGPEAQLSGALFASFQDVETRTRIYPEGGHEFLTLYIRGESELGNKDERLQASVTIPMASTIGFPYEEEFVFGGEGLPGPGEFTGSCSYSVTEQDDYRAWFSFTAHTLQVRIRSFEDGVLVGNISMRARQNAGLQSEHGIVEEVVLEREGIIVVLWKRDADT